MWWFGAPPPADSYDIPVAWLMKRHLAENRDTDATFVKAESIPFEIVKVRAACRGAKLYRAEDELERIELGRFIPWDDGNSPRIRLGYAQQVHD